MPDVVPILSQPPATATATHLLRLRATATAAMAQIPFAIARSLAELQALIAAGEPGDFVLAVIDPVREAPLFHAVVEQLRANGWTCLNVQEVNRTASFAATLHILAADVFPALLVDARDVAALRSLRSCGQAILNVHRDSATGAAELFNMAGIFSNSNSLERKALEALSKHDTYTIPTEWVVAKVREVERTRASRVGYEDVIAALLARALPPQLPLRVVAKLEDIEALILAPDMPPHQINVISIEYLLHAPLYYSTISDKVAAGWTCLTLPQLDQAKRFAGRLADLVDSILPRLRNDAENRQELRRLRACGKGIRKIRRHAHGLLAEMMGGYSNSLEHAASNALKTRRAFTLSLDWINKLAAKVHHDRGSTISL